MADEEKSRVPMGDRGLKIEIHKPTPERPDRILDTGQINRIKSVPHVPPKEDTEEKPS
jgi:hypothetical protein